MRLELRYAGLDPSMEQRLRLAANALAAHRVEARASEWDGTRCDIVAADPGDAYGRRVLEIARRRGTPALEIGSARVAEHSGTTVARLTRALHDLLQGGGQRERRQPSPSAPAAAVSDLCGLVRLATDEALAGKDVEARFQNVAVWLLPRSGRVLSATVSDQIRARDRLASDPQWTFVVLPDRQRGEPPGEVSTSLDAFLMQAAWAARAQLPSFPDREVALDDWPDLGAAASLMEPLAVAQALQRGPASPGQVARRTGVKEEDVSACLWAFKSAGLLRYRMPAVPREPAPSKSGGLFARLASHFGLSRK